MEENIAITPESNELISKKARLAYPIHNGIPIMVIKKARKL